MSVITKDQFENTTGHWVGVVVISRDGRAKGVNVEPHSRIWLSADEQALTAEAPRLAKDNPLANGKLKLVQEGANLRSTRPTRPDGSVEIQQSPEPVEPQKPKPVTKKQPPVQKGALSGSSDTTPPADTETKSDGNPTPPTSGEKPQPIQKPAEKAEAEKVTAPF